MTERTRELVVMISHGVDDELSSVGFTIANGGLSAGLSVLVFLTSAGVEIAGASVMHERFLRGAASLSF